MQLKNKINNFFRQFNPFVECWIWLFFAAVVFVLGLWLHASVRPIIFIYQAILASFLLSILVFFYQHRKRWNSPIFLASICFFLYFLLKGAYLEFASDVWENFRLITNWQSQAVFPNYPESQGRFWLHLPRFNYLFYWAQIHDLPRTSWRMAVNVISASTITLLFIQIYSLAKEFQPEIRSALWMAIFGFIFTGIFNLNYFYYLSLSANILAFILYYRALLSILRFLRLRSREIWIVLPIFLTMIFTHAQGLLLLMECAPALIYFYYSSTPESSKKTKLNWTFILSVAAASVFLLVKHYDDFFKTYAQESGAYFDTLARPGLIAVVIGFFYRRRMRLLWALNIVPIFLIATPLFSYPMLKYGVESLIYGHRFLYLLPTGFIVFQVSQFLLLEKFNHWKNTMVSAVLIVVLSFDARGPWFGRLPHLSLPIPDELSLKEYEPMVFWLEKNRPQVLSTCRLATDQVTDFLLTTYFGWSLQTPRITRLDWAYEALFEKAKLDPEYCGILIRDWTKAHRLPESKVNNFLHHWTPDISQPDLSTTDKMKAIAQEMISKNWMVTHLPADYILLEKK